MDFTTLLLLVLLLGVMAVAILSVRAARKRRPPPVQQDQPPALGDDLGDEDTLPSIRSPVAEDPHGTATTSKQPALRGKRPQD